MHDSWFLRACARGNLHLGYEPDDPLPAVLDAYIIEDIKRREEKRRQDEDERRPRIHIDPVRPDPCEQEDESDSDDDDEEEEESIRIDLDNPTIPAETEGFCAVNFL